MSDALDLRGVICPLNFVKAKIALEPLVEGDTLEILLDDGEPVRNVPRSLRDDGDEVLSLTRTEEGHWLANVRKKAQA
ncbi:MAG TPA: sulfurtransferase TusA family protein [Coriobacteriia bacterium]|jgi:sulfite reductase (ferredoxin)